MPIEATFITAWVLILIFSVILHEVMHGYAALKFGDHTAERAGRLTLNPIPHIDPIGTILVPAIFIIPSILTGTAPSIFLAWAKPVPVNPLNFKDIKRGEIVVSLAGIGANLALAVFGAVVFHMLNNFYPAPLLLAISFVAINLNLMLAVFNLLPIPPLDGSKVLMTLLPYHLAKQYQSIEQYGFIILIGLMLLKFGDASILGIYVGFMVGLLRNLLFL